MASFGVSTVDGTLAPCRAKPENRGRGTCTHGDHVDLEGPMAAPETIRAYNEERLAEHYKASALASLKKALPKPPVPKPPTFPRVTAQGIQAAPNGTRLNRKEFVEATVAISDVFPEGAWEELNGLSKQVSSLIEQEASHARTSREVQVKVQAFLESDDEVAVKIRAYLGPDVSPGDFAAILVHDVKSMTAQSALRNHPKSDPVSRVMLTSVANDMGKRRYIASVLFFGGRCCYCNRTMSKRPGPQQATGEHITPINPATPGAPIGATRYGNMALACHQCNEDRGNKDLHEWVKETDCIPPESKEPALQRIQAFRRFALYEDYSPDQSRKLAQAVRELKREQARVRKSDGTYESEDFEAFQNRVKSKIYDLRQELSA